MAFMAYWDLYPWHKGIPCLGYRKEFFRRINEWITEKNKWLYSHPKTWHRLSLCHTNFPYDFFQPPTTTLSNIFTAKCTISRLNSRFDNSNYQASLWSACPSSSARYTTRAKRCGTDWACCWTRATSDDRWFSSRQSPRFCAIPSELEIPDFFCRRFLSNIHNLYDPQVQATTARDSSAAKW